MYFFRFLLNVLSLVLDFFNSIRAVVFSGRRSETFVYAKRGIFRKRLTLYLPDGASAAQPCPLIVYLHGGGWIVGHRLLLQPAVLKQLERGYAVATVSYTFTHLAQWPTQAHEAKAAIRWLRGNAERFHLDPECFIMWGLSAGGHISSNVGASSGTEHLEGTLGEYLDVSSEVHGVLAWYPPTDLSQMKNHGFFATLTNIAASALIGGWLSKHIEKTQLANPVHYIHQGTPPFYLLHGSKDTIVNQDQSVILYNALQKAGIASTYVPLDGFYHGDVRFNKAEHVAGMEDFLDGIAVNKVVQVTGDE